jgi:hypothetical protein
MKRVIALIVAALLLAAGTGVASYYYLQQAEDRALAQYDSVAVLQVTGGIPAGYAFADAQAQGLIKTVQLPVKFALPSMLHPDTVVDPAYVAAHDVADGQLLMAGDFQRTIATTQVLPIKDGFVAMSTSADAAARLAPFLSPGDHVSLMSNLGGNGPRIVFADLEVIAIGSNSTVGTGIGGDVPGLLTFAVSAKRATEFVSALQAGGLYFALLPSSSVTVN